MLRAPIPENEPERIASLRRMLLLSSPDEEAFERVTRTARRLFDAPIVLLSLVDERRQWFKSCIGLPIRETARDISFCGHAIMDDAVFVVEDARQDPRFFDNPLVTGEPHVVFYAGRPLRNLEGFRVGTLCVIDDAPRHFSCADRKALNDLGYWVEAIFCSRELSEVQKWVLQEFDEVRRLSLLDPMLNIWNRGASEALLEREFEHAARASLPLSLLMIDVDSFKEINDSHGHPLGDAVLIEFVKRLLMQLRSYDIIGRYGGDEFMVILPNTDLDGARAIGERLLESIKETPFMLHESLLKVSASVGVGCVNPLAQPQVMAKDLVRIADNGLLDAKRTGRSRVRSRPMTM